MTYARNVGSTPATPDEPAYSPFVPDYEASAMDGMGDYEVFGPPVSYPAFPAAPAPARALRPLPMMPVPRPYQQLPGYKLVPLSGDGPSKGMTRGQKILAVIVVIGIVAAIVYMVRKSKSTTAKEPVTPSQAIKKAPTARLAKNLYERLARNGKGTRSVMTALSQLSEE